MLFSSLEFLFLFLPLTMAVYFAVPRRARNLVLLLSGLAFYGFGEPKFLPLMAWTILRNYLLARWIARRHRKGKKAKLWLVIAVILNIGQLAFFKYFDFFGIGLPIGISFYTFQALSYVIDVYWQKASATRSLVDFGAYVSLFPQLIAGPIVKYTDVDAELKCRRHDLGDIASGLRTFCAGLAKKVLLANPAGELWERLAEDTSLVGSLLAVLFFALQIYFDFSGYSDMAVGLGRIFGFRFPQNFNYPYISKSITEFWRRWHITLSSWFREYVYIPLGGNRRGRARTIFNLITTWALTGIWHGATLNFLLWGLYFALLLILEKFVFARLLSCLPSALSHIYALIFIALGWVIFASDGSIEGLNGLALTLRLFGIGCESLASERALYELWRNLPFLAIAVLGATPLPRKIYLMAQAKARTVSLALLDTLMPLGALILCVAYIIGSGYNPFLYFRF